MGGPAGRVPEINRARLPRTALFFTLAGPDAPRNRKGRETMIEIITKINSAVNNFVWGPVMLLLLVGTGVYLTARTGCIQAAKLGISCAIRWAHCFAGGRSGTRMPRTSPPFRQ